MKNRSVRSRDRKLLKCKTAAHGFIRCFGSLMFIVVIVPEEDYSKSQ